MSQLGIDRIVDLQFGSDEAAYHLIVELYDRVSEGSSSVPWGQGHEGGLTEAPCAPRGTLSSLTTSTSSSTS